MQRVCVTDTHGLRGGADVNRAQDLDCAVSMQRMRVTDTHGLRGGADVNRARDLDRVSACSVCVSHTHMVYEVGPAHVCQKTHLI